MKPFKKTILVDLDGVLNQYTGGYNEDFIPPIREGAYDFLKKLSESYKVIIFTSRDSSKISKWIEENGLKDLISDVTNTKVPSFLMIDDRCLNFRGNYEQTLEDVLNFKPWYR